MTIRDQRGLSRNVMLVGLVVIILAGSYFYVTIKDKKKSMEAIENASATTFEQYQLGPLSVEMPAGGEFETNEITLREGDEEFVESATNYVYNVQGFTCFITRATYADEVDPELTQLAGSIIAQMKSQPTVDLTADFEELTVSERPAVLISLAFETKGTDTAGRTLIVENENNEYWMVNLQTFANDENAVPVMQRVMESVRFD